MTAASYIPNRGDLVWLDFSPQVGREQAGRRPALVLSREGYNRPSGLALFCPVTSRRKGYPFEVAIPEGLPVTGVVLADQVRSLDWTGRNIVRIATADECLVAEVGARVEALLR
ncbi:MAG: endoribonuclease MazF [Armatimonadetes bacterium]|nr:endoribonuclease MazF [Armatimonadota bacterium]